MNKRSFFTTLVFVVSSACSHQPIAPGGGVWQRGYIEKRLIENETPIEAIVKRMPAKPNPDNEELYRGIDSSRYLLTVLPLPPEQMAYRIATWGYINKWDKEKVSSTLHEHLPAFRDKNCFLVGTYGISRRDVSLNYHRFIIDNSAGKHAELFPLDDGTPFFLADEMQDELSYGKVVTITGGKVDSFLKRSGGHRSFEVEPQVYSSSNVYCSKTKVSTGDGFVVLVEHRTSYDPEIDDLVWSPLNDAKDAYKYYPGVRFPDAPDLRDQIFNPGVTTPNTEYRAWISARQSKVQNRYREISQPSE